MSLQLLLTWMLITGIGTAIPGPDFMYISSVSLHERKYGFWATLGVQTGVIWNSLLGFLGVMIINFGNFLPYVSIVGGLYIFYIGWCVAGQFLKAYYAQLKAFICKCLASTKSASQTNDVNQSDNASGSSNISANNTRTYDHKTTTVDETQDLNNEFSQASLYKSAKFKVFNFKTIYRRGLLVNMFNPKCAIFMITVLPRFVDTTKSFSVSMQLLVLLIVNLIIGFMIWFTVVFFVSTISKKFASEAFREKLETVSGVILMFLGILLFLSVWF